MSRLRVAPIVEGHGEVAAVRRLLERVWYELLGGEYLDVVRPFRERRSRIVRISRDGKRPSVDKDVLARAVTYVSLKLGERRSSDENALVLLLLDANSDCPKELAPELLDAIEACQIAEDCSVVLANVEFETWFVGAAASLTDFLRVEPKGGPLEPEKQRSGKGWIQKRFLRDKYSETIDQVKLTNAMDLNLCKERCPSFDKLVRDLRRFVSPSDNH